MTEKIKVIDSDQGIAICVAPMKILSDFVDSKMFGLCMVHEEVGLFCLANSEEIEHLGIKEEVTYDAFRIKFISSIDFDNATCEGF